MFALFALIDREIRKEEDEGGEEDGGREGGRRGKKGPTTLSPLHQ
jgi:hypothetical protein